MTATPKVKVIRGTQARPLVKATTERETLPKKKRVAAYCRVSTDHEDQETSYEAQQRHFSSLINENPAWELVNIYADEESGTRVEKRENFMRMIEDCESGAIDMVLTKSISRWARNTLDSLKYIRKLKALNIPILFTKEGINTMDAGGEILVTIMSSIAQQESASISQNVQIGVRYHYQEGKVCSGVHRLLGYNRTKDGSLEVVPEEAEIIRRIYREYLDGFTSKHICERLKAEDVDGTKVTNTGIELPRVWSRSGIEYILKNEKYAGDLILQKYYTVDFLTKKIAVNTGQLPQYFVENSHEPIVPKDIYLQVQAEMARRKKHWQDFRYSHSNALAGRTVCGECGAPYRRVGGKGGRWRCETKTHKERQPGVECSNGSVSEWELKRAVAKAFEELPTRRDELIRLDERLRWGGLNRANELLTEIEDEIKGYEEKEHLDADSEETLLELRQQWTEISEQRAVYIDKALHIQNLVDLIRIMKEGNDAAVYKLCPDGSCENADDFFKVTRPEFIEGYSEDAVIRYIERIEVKGESIVVRFKAGISTEIER